MDLANDEQRNLLNKPLSLSGNPPTVVEFVGAHLVSILRDNLSGSGSREDTVRTFKLCMSLG
jgi:hypothetical protein